MTSEYDMLASIYQMAESNAEFRKTAEWLFDICIEQANRAKEGWNFEHWKKRWGEIYEDEFKSKAMFLNDCHDSLAHKQINAFDVDTHLLIDIIYTAFTGRDVYRVNKLKKRFPELPEILERLGYTAMSKDGWMWTK